MYMYMYIIHVYTHLFEANTHCNDVQSKSILQKYILLQLSCTTIIPEARKDKKRKKQAVCFLGHFRPKESSYTSPNM